MSFTQREARRIIRQAVHRVPEGEEIRHLNIMPMMDMMTILLVAFIFQMASSSNDIAAGQVTLPHTPSSEEITERVVTMIVTKNGVVVEGKSIVSIANGQVDSSKKPDGVNGLKIAPLTTFLANLRTSEIANWKRDPANPWDNSVDGKPPKKSQPGEIMIIADRTTPYRVLVEVMFSAKETEKEVESGYKRFRLIVQKSGGVGVPAK